MEYIVKYNNRKLYSKVHNQYVNLDYLVDLVRTNQENKFTVVKYEKGIEAHDMQDITGEVLAEAVARLKPSKAKLIRLIKETK